MRVFLKLLFRVLPIGVWLAFVNHSADVLEKSENHAKKSNFLVVVQVIQFKIPT